MDNTTEHLWHSQDPAPEAQCCSDPTTIVVGGTLMCISHPASSFKPMQLQHKHKQP